MIEFPYAGWEITQIDQSIAAARIRDRDPNRHSGVAGVRIMAEASGARYDAWVAAVRTDNASEIERIIIHAVGIGRTYDDALQQLSDTVATIESENHL